MGTQQKVYTPEELEKLRSVAVFPQGKRLKRVTRPDTTGSTITDHWDGRRDSNVRVKAFRVGGGNRRHDE